MEGFVRFCGGGGGKQGGRDMDMALRFAVNGRYWLGESGSTTLQVQCPLRTGPAACPLPPGGFFSHTRTSKGKNTTARDGVMRKREMIETGPSSTCYRVTRPRVKKILPPPESRFGRDLGTDGRSSHQDWIDSGLGPSQSGFARCRFPKHSFKWEPPGSGTKNTPGSFVCTAERERKEQRES